MNENTFAIFKEKIQPTRALIDKMKAALDKRPEILAEEKMKELQRARAYANRHREITCGSQLDPPTKAEEAINRLTLEIKQLEEHGPFLPGEAAVYAAELSIALQDAERWAYILMLNDLLDVFTGLTYWQDLQLEAINTGYAYFNRAQYWPEHWKLSKHAETELRIMQLVDEITEIVMQEGQAITAELYTGKEN